MRDPMIVCIRTVRIPPEARERFLAWIDENRQLREEHGILFELVLERSLKQNPTKTMQGPELEPPPDDDALVLTAWASHEAFDAWIDTPDRDGLTDSDDHRAVQYRPLTRYDLVGGYLNLDGLTAVAEVEEEP
jgi:heme-degrading monooxygenase HmoA